MTTLDEHTEGPAIGLFAGDLDVDQFELVRVFINAEHDPGSEELELKVYNDRVRFTGYTDSIETFTYELTWKQLAELAAFVVEH